MDTRYWKLVRVIPTRPEPTRTVIGVFDTSEEAWAEHDRIVYGDGRSPDPDEGYVQIVRFDGTVV